MRMKQAGLALPSKPHQVSAVTDPKQMLEQLVRLARGKRKTTLDDQYDLMGERIRLETLSKVASYNRFVRNLTDKLVELHKLRT